MKLYIRTTTDEYELPVAVAGSIQELADMLKVKYMTVAACISNKRKGWYKIEVEDD